MACPKNRAIIDNGKIVIVDPTNVVEVRKLFSGCPDCNNSNCLIRKVIV